ncbi:MAG: hypothetical protein GY771_09525 [bacterium]|nr:hypothetical protein [bacterium]
MKWLLFILIPVLAFAAKGELVGNLCTHGVYSWDYRFYTNGGEYDYWVAFDYDPTDSYIVDQVKMDWVYVSGIHDDMNFDIYLEDFDDPPIISFTVAGEDYTESDTGFGYVGYDVIRGDIPLGDNAFSFSPGNKYWLALQIDCTGSAFATLWESEVGEPAWCNGDLGWYSDEYSDCSYAIYGESTGVEGASLGEIKALFK